jgi:hypothetical protein
MKMNNRLFSFDRAPKMTLLIRNNISAQLTAMGIAEGNIYEIKF